MTEPLPAFDEIAIDYVLRDRFGFPDNDDIVDRHVQAIHGIVTGVCYTSDDELLDEFTPLGEIDLSIIRRFEADDEVSMSMALDEQQDWIENYAELVDDAEHDILPCGIPGPLYFDRLLLLDHVKIPREARGHGLGLHVVSRALSTWTESGDLILLTAAPTEGAPTPQAFEKLARYWSKLGLRRYPGGGLPVLYAHSDTVYDFSHFHAWPLVPQG